MSLELNGARYYNPAIARFITPDIFIQNPFDPQSLNRYTYARNNPVFYVDPTGHFWFFAFVAAIFKAASAYAIAHPIIASAVMGGFLGGVNSAISGTNVLQGMGIGILSGVIGGGVGLGVGNFLKEGLGSFWAGMAGAGLGGATAGAAASGVLGGDVGLGALAGLAGGIISFSGARVWSLGADAVAGGVSSVIQGGEFGEGAKFGAIDNAIITATELLMPMEKLANQEVKPGDLAFMKPDSALGYLISFFEGGAFSHVKLAIDNEHFMSATPQKGVNVFKIKDYSDRQTRILKNFRGDQRVINAAKNLSVSKLPYNYVILERGKVCSTSCGNAISVGTGISWTGIGPNSQYNVFKSYGE